MSVKTDRFIAAIAPLARNEYLNRDRWVLPSICIAMGAKESGWNADATTIFGIKSDGIGEELISKTTEYYNGIKDDDVIAAWEAYPSIAYSVKDFYDLITQADRYAGAVNNTDYKSSARAIREGGYATAPAEEYIQSVIDIIEQFGLTEFDTTESQTEEVEETAVEENISEPQSTVGEITVQPGEGFWNLAQRGLGDGNRYIELAEFNGMDVNSTQLYAGMVLRLPSGNGEPDTQEVQCENQEPVEEQVNEESTISVLPGEGFWQVAARALGDGNRYIELAQYNGLDLNTTLYSGMELRLPQ